jgi:hypothetical protein
MTIVFKIAFELLRELARYGINKLEEIVAKSGKRG